MYIHARQYYFTSENRTIAHPDKIKGFKNQINEMVRNLFRKENRKDWKTDEDYRMLTRPY